MDKNNRDGMLAINEAISDQQLNGLCAIAPQAYQGVSGAVEKNQVRGIFISRAMQLGTDAVKILNKIFDQLEKADRLSEEEAQKVSNYNAANEFPVYLDLDKNGVPVSSLNNYQRIMFFDPQYEKYHYNLLKAAPEIHLIENGKLTIKDWEDADEAESQRYIEEQYKMYSDQKHKKALLLLFQEREYNPVMDIVEALPAWDGTERIGAFLTKWMGCEDSDYTREVSRLIFAGGINRLYEPGCKFDDVPVLIGTKQGEGKSSIIRWLAINDNYYSEVTQFEGKESIEQLEGAWICEISEMLALNKTSEQEAVKAFITRQIDKYRKPYARSPSSLPRRCVFIGTTNNRRFLKDKTGNRRFYPVEVNMDGYALHDIEQECREYILQCWAEARDKYKRGEMKNFANRDLVATYRAVQDAAMEDDWREGAINEYLAKFSKGDRVCIRMVAREALTMQDETPKDPTKKDAHEIGVMIDKNPEWRRLNGMYKINNVYGRQKGWEKIVGSESDGEDYYDELPF